MRAELVKTEKGSDTMTNKMTYVDALRTVLSLVDAEKMYPNPVWAEGMEVTPKEFSGADLLEKLEACKASYEKRNASKSKGERKPTKKQIENEGIKARIVELLTGHEPMQAKEVAAELELSSSQQASALLRQLVEAGTVEKVVEKRVSRFQVKGE